MSAQVQPHDTAAVHTSTVLIVDETAAVRDLYQEYLDFCGFRVVCAYGAAEALHVAQTEPPDVILVDVGRAADAGCETIRRLKAWPPTAGVPIVALTAFTAPDAAANARAAGADVCLAKPCLPSQIARAIRALLLWPRRA